MCVRVGSAEIDNRPKKLLALEALSTGSIENIPATEIKSLVDEHLAMPATITAEELKAREEILTKSNQARIQADLLKLESDFCRRQALTMMSSILALFGYDPWTKKARTLENTQLELLEQSCTLQQKVIELPAGPAVQLSPDTSVAISNKGLETLRSLARQHEEQERPFIKFKSQLTDEERHKLLLHQTFHPREELEDLEKWLKSKRLQAEVRSFLEAEAEKQPAILKKLENKVNPDPSPFPPGPEDEVAYSETLRVLRAVSDISHNFGAFAEECKRLPDGSLSLMGSFASECTSNSYALHATSNECFPGRGIAISGFNINEIFPMSLADIEKAAPWFAGGIADLEDMDISLTRGLIQLRGGKDFELFRTSVALTVHNNHFSDSLYLASLDPKTLSEKYFKMAQEPLMDYVGSGTYDLNESALRFEQVEHAAHDQNLPFAKLDLGSNLFGRLGNSLDPTFLANELQYSYSPNSSQDVWGRPHKYYILGENRSRIPVFQNIHSQVYRTASRYLKAFHAFCAGYNLWKCGESPCSQGLPLLEQAYLMHQLYKEKDSKYSPPILCLASGVPLGGEVTPILDPVDMSLTIGTNKIQFPLDGYSDGDIEKAIWEKHVRPLYMHDAQISLTTSLRFMQRDALKEKDKKEKK